jgi:malonyl CoA-acyl carrier protein transacylase
MRALVGLGAEGFLEVGTGRVLKGLLGKIEKGVKCWNVEDPETLAAALGELKILRVSAGAP